MWDDFDNNSIFNAFLLLYLNNLETDAELIRSLTSVVYHLDEANSDKEAKQVIQNYMYENSCLPNDAIMNLKVMVGSAVEEFTYSDLSQVEIENVYLPDQITDDMRSRIKKSKQNSVYTKPDLYVELRFKDLTYFTEIELKSTKVNSIPGSSVQQIDPYGWVIFIKQGDTVQITTGLYVNSITDSMQFPDRSPRPKVAFNTLHTWNNNNFRLRNNGYDLLYDKSEITAKKLIITDWKQVLVSRWIDIVLDDKLSLEHRTPWFTETITMFTNQLLEGYESLSVDEKQQFRRNLSSILANK